MLVTVTRPIEEALNTVPGLEHVQVHHQPRHGEIDLFFSGRSTCSRRWNWSTRRSRACSPDAAADREDHRQPAHVRGVPDHGLQPHFGHGAADALWEMATYQI
jgi:hypothetical protein